MSLFTRIPHLASKWCQNAQQRRTKEPKRPKLLSWAPPGHPRAIPRAPGPQGPYGRRNKGFAQGFLRKATRATIVFRGYNRYFGGPRGPGVVRNRVNLSFLSTALDPQADVILSQSYEGFMPIFRFYKNRIFGKK